MSKDNPVSTSDEKRDIHERNRILERAGATSRYIDSKPESDFTFEGETHSALDSRDAPDEVPEHLRLRAEEMEVETHKELARRGIVRGERECITVGGPQTDPIVERAAVVVRLLKSQRALGFGYTKYETELADLIEAKWPHDTRHECQTCKGRMTWDRGMDGNQYLVHAHLDSIPICERMVNLEAMAAKKLFQEELDACGSLTDPGVNVE